MLTVLRTHNGHIDCVCVCGGRRRINILHSTLRLKVIAVRTAPPGKVPMTEAQRERLDKLKKTPRRRPDWSTMMKEIGQPRSLKKVQCNDRSAPIVKNLKRKDNEVGKGIGVRFVSDRSLVRILMR